MEFFVVSGVDIDQIVKYLLEELLVELVTTVGMKLDFEFVR